jgi:AraC family transcriptional regulator
MASTALEIAPTPGFTIAEVEYRPHFYQPWHEHEETRLIVNVRGGFTEQWARRQYSCGPASAFLRPAGERHTDRYHASGALCINVRFGASWAGETGAYGEVAGLSGRLYREFRAGDSASPMGIQCAVLEIMAQLLRPQAGHRERVAPPWIEAAKDLLRSRLSSPPDLFETAHVAGVHPAHLARSFRQFTGMTMGAYLRRKRVEFACGRLRRSQDSLAAIAAEAGFYDQAHFSRVFRQQMAMTPKEFRHGH